MNKQNTPRHRDTSRSRTRQMSNGSHEQYGSANNDTAPKNRHPGSSPYDYHGRTSRKTTRRQVTAQYATSRQDFNSRHAHQRNTHLYRSGSHASTTSSQHAPNFLFIVGGIILAAIIVFFIGSSILNALTAPSQQPEEPLNVTETAPTPTTLTISFAGDCTLGTDSSFDPSTSFNAVYDDVNDPSYFMKNVADLFGSDDYTVANMEGTLTESDSRQDKTYAFKGPAEYTEILKSGNIEAVSLANNHSHDYGDQSYTDTIAALDKAGIVNFGYDRIAYADIKGVKVALIGTYMLAEGLNIKDEMLTNIEAAKSEGAQIIIVFTHWGTEKETVPDADQVELGHAAIDAGATIVVGSHPHVIQGYEKYNGRYIVYSLGNFCFGGNKNPSDKDCMIFQQTFTVTGNDVATDDAINVIPCSISSSSSSNNYQPTPAEDSEAERILAKIEDSNSAISKISVES